MNSSDTQAAGNLDLIQLKIASISFITPLDFACDYAILGALYIINKN